MFARPFGKLTYFQNFLWQHIYSLNAADLLLDTKQCDEAHPACRNCQKSKRECLGYDPIFKSQPGPPSIQPALGATTSMQPNSTNSSPYPPPPQGYVPAGTQGYGPAGTGSENSAVEPYDYSAAIDPALEGGATAHMQNSKGNIGTGSPYPPNASDQHGHRGEFVQMLVLNYSPRNLLTHTLQQSERRLKSSFASEEYPHHHLLNLLQHQLLRGKKLSTYGSLCTRLV